MPLRDVERLRNNTDARIWVDEWLKTIAEDSSIATDKDTMIIWFSNAIITGYDSGRKFERRIDIVDKLREIIFQAAGAATRPLLEDHPNYVFPSERVVEAIDYVCADFGIPTTEELKEKHAS
jgi:hypothetical protein